MSTQNTETPWPFIRAVEKYFDIRFAYDMAADDGNRKAPKHYDGRDNSLAMDWPLDGWLWLNPPYRNLTAWTRKCVEQYRRGCKIISIWPLSGDLNQVDVWRSARVYVIHGRIWPLVRGCMLSVWSLDTLIKNPTGLRWDGEKLSKEWPL